MPAKNYYVVLGVPRDESSAGIRSAYHELARRMHPDTAGPADTSRFKEINDSYEVLSDPDRRRAHDRDFGEPERVTKVPARHQPPRWPIAPEPISLFGQPEQTKPSFDAFRERYLRNFTGRKTPKAERAESLTLDVAL
jgi:DnaJ-class molecular chaperone